MSATWRFFASVAGLTLACVALSAQQPSTAHQSCEAPSLIGICDPYVPGTIIAKSPDGRVITVLDTWPDGPAEKAGICPRDQIVAVDGIPVSGHTFGQMVKQIVSPSPSPITLKVKRLNEETEFHLDRVRESTLAQLSHEKFMLWRGPFEGIRWGIVPLEEAREELQQLAQFCDGIDRRLGYKFIDGMDVPKGTPEEQVKKLALTKGGGPQGARLVGATPSVLAENSSTPAFTTVLLKNPEEVLVDMVIPDSAAHRSGLFPGDQILEVNGHPVAGLNQDQLTDLILKPDQPREMSLRVRRGTSTVELRIHTEEAKQLGAPSAFQRVPGHLTSTKPDSYVLGFSVLYAENPREAVIDEVDYPSPGFDAGLHVGDRVLGVSGVPIEQISSQLLREKLQVNGAAEFKLEVLRLGKELEFRIKPTTYAEAEAKIGRKIIKNTPVPAHCPEG
jgi:C-terminal processing protease CtpA/Prc